MKRKRLSQRTSPKLKTTLYLKYVKAGIALGAMVFIIIFVYNNLGLSVFNESKALSDSCPSAQGDETSYGNGVWTGYVYNERRNFNAINYQGFITESEIFDESFCGDNCDFVTNGCAVNTETFSVRFKMNKNFGCGAYRVTVGGDDGVRLSIDGGVNFILGDYRDQPYAIYSNVIGLDGSTDLVLEYYENRGRNRVSFNYTYLGPTFSGEIGDDQTYCSMGSIDPAPIRSVSSALICGSTLSYQWEISTDNTNFSDIPDGIAEGYDPPAGLTETTYYRRKAFNNDTTLYSNVVTLTIQEPEGDQTTYGDNSWIGYVYDGRNEFGSSAYRGYITESDIFDDRFCGNRCDFATVGCDVYTEMFSVRYKMRKNFDCGVYAITIGADDGVRLSIDGGSSYVIDGYRDQAYRQYSDTIPLKGVYELVLEYYENRGGNRVSFDYTRVGNTYEGEISGDQSLCAAESADPTSLGNQNDAFICGSVVNYQWQQSTDASSFEDITGANRSSYDPPSGLMNTTYYRRKATDGSTNLFSNIVSVQVKLAEGDQVSYGDDAWICYLYDGADNFASADYQGFDTVTEQFDKDFGDSRNTISPNGCETAAETFSARFKMSKSFVCGTYTFTIGGDEAVRLSIDGGNTYLIDDYSPHTYRTQSSEAVQLEGDHDMILEYYGTTGSNRISFSYEEAGGCVLPIELIYFKAKLDDNGQVKIAWKSATEENNDYYTILRGSSPTDMHEIARIEGAGTSFEALEYDYIDRNPLPGRSYYRLKQTDFNGMFEAFDLVTIDNNDPNNALEISSATPNPFSDKVEINFTANQGQVQLDILSLEGNLIHHEQLQVQHGANSYFFDRGYDLPKGLYIVRLQQVGHDPQMVKLMKR